MTYDLDFTDEELQIGGAFDVIIGTSTDKLGAYNSDHFIATRNHRTEWNYGPLFYPGVLNKWSACSWNLSYWLWFAGYNPSFTDPTPEGRTVTLPIRPIVALTLDYIEIDTGHEGSKADPFTLQSK